jgi:Protein of unknown function (DUF2505)
VKIEITHEIDAPIDAIELAFLSPEMGAMLGRALAPTVTSVETTLHDISSGLFLRTLRFHASAPSSLVVARALPKDALTWETRVRYPIGTHTSTWEVLPLEQYRRYFRASGAYRLEPVAEGRTLRRVTGDVEIVIPLPLMGGLVERLVRSEVRKTYDAEAETLRKLATL